MHNIRPLQMIILPLLLGLAVALAGCGGHDHDHHDHDEIGPHGGFILETGEDDVHVEYLHQPDEARVILYILDGQLEPLPRADEPPTISLIVAGQPRQIDTTPLPEVDYAFKATDELFRGEDFQARATFFVAGQGYQVDLVEPHDHHHH